MIDGLFLVLVSIFVPIIIFTGVRIYKGNTWKLKNILTLVFLGFELIRFFCSAAFYEKAATPSQDIKFHYITLMCIAGLFAAFNSSKLAGSGILKNIFCLTALAPIIFGLFDSRIYINALDVNAVCKAAYMLECGFVLTLAGLYVSDKNVKIGVRDILWAAIFLLLFVGMDALCIWWWKKPIAYDLMWYFAWVTCILAISACFGLNRLCLFLAELVEGPGTA